MNRERFVMAKLSAVENNRRAHLVLKASAVSRLTVSSMVALKAREQMN